jgi:methyltransferase (TIGR00027 family)
MGDSPLANVSDTARWVAVYRAWESLRPDALFHDPFAERLAGERGRASAALMTRQARNGWPIIARTRLIDDLVIAAIAQGCDCVVNLAAGLDTRPYRLDLPPTLRWIEADLPDLIAEKQSLLADARPRCELHRVKVDLADAGARERVLQEAIGASTQTLVITEGLLIYLDIADVRSLAASLTACSGIRWWVMDLASPAVVQMMRRSMGRLLANAPLKFAPPEGVAFFEAFGWTVDRVDSLLHAAARYRRLSGLLRLFAWFPAADPRRLARARWSGVVQLTRPLARSAAREAHRDS